MKNIIFISLLILSFSCKKEEDKTTATPALNTNLVLSKTEIPVAAPIRNLSSSFWVGKLSDADIFYIHNLSNTGDSEAKGMMFYSVFGNTFTDYSYSEDVAAAGYMSKLVSVGGLYLYYCASDFVRYNRFSNSWDEGTNYPDNIHDNNAETGVCVFDRDIYFIGGRIACKTVKFYDTDTQIWTNSADYPIDIGNTASATDKVRYIYSLGGGEGLDYQPTKKFYRYDTQDNSWQEMPDCPREIRQSITLNLMCFFKGKYLAVLCEDNKIYIYNIETNQWQTSGLETGLTIDTIYAHLEASTDGTKFYVLYKKENDQLGISVYSPI